MGWFRRNRRPAAQAAQQDSWDRIQEQVRAAKQSRLEQTATQRDLVQAVSAVLFRADPVGIAFDTNTDEYDSEAETIVIALPGAAGPADVQAITHETFTAWFDATTAGPIERYERVAGDIWTLWRRHQHDTAPTPP